MDGKSTQSARVCWVHAAWIVSAGGAVRPAPGWAPCTMPGCEGGGRYVVAFACGQGLPVYPGYRDSGGELGMVRCWRHKADGKLCGGTECKEGTP